MKELTDLIREYEAWYKALPKKEKTYFDYLQLNGFNATLENRNLLWSAFLWRYEFYEFRYKSIDDFLSEEIFLAIKNITDQNMDFGNVSYLVKLKARNFKFDQPFGGELSTNDIGIILYFILKELNIIDQILNSAVKLYDKPDTEIMIRDRKVSFGQILVLLGSCQFLQELLYIKSDKDILEAMKEGNSDNKKQPKKEISYNSVFRDKSVGGTIKKILEESNYTKKGEWRGHTNEKSELLCLIWVLFEGGVFKTKKIQPIVRAFYKEFGLPEDHTSARMTYSARYFLSDSRKEFFKLFHKLLTPQK